jgi:hypothetical protein
MIRSQRMLLNIATAAAVVILLVVLISKSPVFEGNSAMTSSSAIVSSATASPWKSGTRDANRIGNQSDEHQDRHRNLPPESNHPNTESIAAVIKKLERLTALAKQQAAEIDALMAKQQLGKTDQGWIRQAQTPVEADRRQALNSQRDILFQEAPASAGFPASATPTTECTNALVVGTGNAPNHSDTYQCRQTDLVLIHIPKTGGTSLEQAGQSLGQGKGIHKQLLWGFQYDKARFRRKRRDLPNGNKLESQIPICVGDFGKKCCSWWHVPPRFVNDWRPYYSAKDRFCVVRNPYARSFSEYSFRHGRKIRELPCEKLNKTRVNEWIRDRLTQTISGKPITLDDCHWYPQYQYIEPYVGADGSRMPPLPRGVNKYLDTGPDGRSCNHVIKMETMSKDLPVLMAKLGHPEVKLPKKKQFSSGCKDLKMLEERTRALIRKVFAQDFRQFEYET